MIETMRNVARRYVCQELRDGANGGDLAIDCAFRGMPSDKAVRLFVREVGPVSPEAVQDAIDEQCQALGFW